MGCCCSSSDSQDITPVPDRPTAEELPPATAFGGDDVGSNPAFTNENG
uniref:Uncharacterized protein n=1 Tax=Anopheles funestus TaxID=62324 RepID=A0A182S1N1_ANOFN